MSGTGRGTGTRASGVRPAWEVPRTQLRLRWALRPALRRWMRLEVEGLEHVPASGPVILAATHRSHADSAALGAALPRPLHFVGDERLLDWPVVGRTLPSFGMIPLRRGSGDEGPLALLGDLLASSTEACVVIYPEGTRSRDGRVHRLRSGLARVAARSGVPIVPVAILGTERVWPIGRPPRPTGGRVRVRFGPPLAPPADDGAARRAFNVTLQAAMAALAEAEVGAGLSPIRGGRGTTP